MRTYLIRVRDAVQRSSRCSAEPGPRLARKLDPGLAAHHAAKGSVLRSIRGTCSALCSPPPPLGESVQRQKRAMQFLTPFGKAIAVRRQLDAVVAGLGVLARDKERFSPGRAAADRRTFSRARSPWPRSRALRLPALEHDPEKLQTFRIRLCVKTTTKSEIAIRPKPISL